MSGSNDSHLQVASSVMITLEEVAMYLRVHKSTVYRLARAGSLPAVKIGGQWRFNQKRVDEWLASHEATSASLDRA